MIQVWHDKNLLTEVRFGRTGQFWLSVMAHHDLEGARGYFPEQRLVNERSPALPLSQKVHNSHYANNRKFLLPL